MYFITKFSQDGEHSLERLNFQYNGQPQLSNVNPYKKHFHYQKQQRYQCINDCDICSNQIVESERLDKQTAQLRNETN